MLASDEALRLRRLWDQHRTRPLPAQPADADPRIQEISLYEAWLGGIVETTLRNGGRVSARDRQRLEARTAEGSQPLWAAATGLGEPVRSHAARLFAIQGLVEGLPSL